MKRSLKELQNEKLYRKMLWLTKNRLELRMKETGEWYWEMDVGVWVKVSDYYDTREEALNWLENIEEGCVVK